MTPHSWTPEYGFIPKEAKYNRRGYPLAGVGKNRTTIKIPQSNVYILYVSKAPVMRWD